MLIVDELVKSAHDLSEGGLAVALAECCITDRNNPIGCSISIESELRPDILLFSESQSRFIISVSEGNVDKVSAALREAAVSFLEIGRVGGDSMTIDSLVECSLAELSDAYHSTLYRYMDQPIQA